MINNATTFGGQRANPTIDLFSNKDKKSNVPNVFFLGTNSRAIAHQRSLIPSKFLARAKSANCGVMFGRFTKEVIDWADVVVFQRVGGRVIEDLVRYCRLTNTATIYDVDDDLFNYPQAKEYETVDTEKVTKDVLGMMQLVDCIVVTEEQIKKSAEEYTIIPIHVIKNYIDIEQWDAPKSKNYNQPEFLIGWAGGHYHSEDLKILEKPIRRILREYPHIKFVTIGDKLNSLFKEFRDRIYYHDFVDISNFPDLMYKMRFSIGLAPLSHSKFSESRSNIRLLHHSLLSIPTIASNFGPYARAKEEGFPFIVVDNREDAWFNALQNLIEDEKKRVYLGASAREAVYQQYRAEKLVPKWAGLIRQAIELSRRKKEELNK